MHDGHGTNNVLGDAMGSHSCDDHAVSEPEPVPEWHRQELEQRLAKADAAPEAAIPWEDVRDRLREKS